jgi:serine/threonine protein kinase
MNNQLQRIASLVERAHRPEDIFGDLGGAPAEMAAALQRAYHQLAKIAHPDAYPDRGDQAAAQSAFARLTEWYHSAQKRLQAGVYGTANPLDNWRVVLHASKRDYVLENEFSEGPIYTSYPASYTQDHQTRAALLKITRDPSNNDLAENEARTLQTLMAGKAVKKFANYLPRLLDSFLYEDDGMFRVVNVFERTPNWHTLGAVRRAYPRGLDPKEVSWIWRRVLVALGFVHLNGQIHGALLPDNIEILPELHGLRLVEWSYAVPLADQDSATSVCLTALDPAYQDWYPEEVQRGETPLPGTDIDMAARCMIDLLGGDPVHKTLPASVHPALRAFFKGCTLPGKRSRPQDAWALKNEYEELIRQLWGEQKFHPFVFHPINQ